MHLPFDVECEQAVLGGCLRDNAHIDKIAEIVGPDDFYDPLHGRMFEAICYLQTEGQVTPMFLNAVMKSDPGMAMVGGAPYLDALRDAAPSLANFTNLARLVRDHSQRRKVIDAGQRMLDAASLPPQEAPTDALIDHFQVEVDQIANGSQTVSKRPVRASDALHAMLRDIERQAVAERPLGVKTGLDPLDRIIGPLLPSKMLIVGARPGMGKSILGTNIARSVAQQGVPADYLVKEMDNDELSARIGCEIDYDRCAQDGLEPLHYGWFVQKSARPEAVHRLAEANIKLQELDLDLFSVPTMTIEWIEALCRRRSRARPGHRIVVIDHLQHVEWEGAPRGANTVQVVSQITMRLKSLAKALGITIVLLSQLSRDLEKREDKHPLMSDFRESGSIEQDADIMIGLMRPMRYAQHGIKAAKNDEQRHKAILAYDEAKNVIEVGVLKNRGGAEADYFRMFIEEKASVIRAQASDSAGDGEFDYGALAKELRG